MLCPKCEAKMAVEKSSPFVGHKTRVMVCACGRRYETNEKITRELQPATSPQLSRNHPAGGIPPSASKPQPPSNGGGYGGDPSESDPELFPDLSDPSLEIDQGVDRAQVSYPAEFELIWGGTGRVGVKYKALKAWKKVGRPAWAMVEPVWCAYMLSDRPVAGFVKDLSTWLNGRCHQQAWEPARRAPGDRSNGMVVDYPKMKPIPPGVAPPPRPRP